MPKKTPLILVTNDDGIFAGGIISLVEVAKEFGKVLVVAPDRPQSGMGHAITVHDPLRMRKVDMGEGVEAYSSTGTPVDCVKLAIYGVLKGKKPDLVLSGINHGQNNSINVIYSGTMSAAVEGAVENIPSIGFSLCDHSPTADFEASKEAARAIIESALREDFPRETCLNVNIPNVKPDQLKGIKICRQARAYWADDFEVRKDPHGQEYYWMTGEMFNQDKGEDTDVWALENNYVSVVPTQYDMTAHHAIATLNEWTCEL